MLDEYDYEDESGSDAAIGGIFSQLINSGTTLASQAIAQSNLQPVSNIPVGYVAAPNQGNSSLIFWLFIGAVAFILYKVL